MTSRRSIAVVAALLLLATGACSGDDDDATTTTTTAEVTTTVDETTTTTTEAELVLVDDDLGIEPRSVRFMNLEFTVQSGVVTNQTLRSVADGDEGDDVVLGEDLHLVLAVDVVNERGRQISVGDDAIVLERNGSDVGLAEPFLFDTTNFVQGGTDLSSYLAFPVDEDFDVTDATLVFGEDPDTPARLPLSGPITEPTHPVEFDLDGSASGVGPTNGGTIEFTVLDGARFLDLPHGETTSPTGERADVGEEFLQVHVRATKTEGRGDDNLGDAFRLEVDDVPIAPFDVAAEPTGSTPVPVAELGAATDAWLLFIVPDDAETFTLLVGDVEADQGMIPLSIG